MRGIQLSSRQEKIVKMVKEEGPITGEQIAQALNLTRATLRPDLAILTMTGILDARPRVGYFYRGRIGPPLGELFKEYKVKDFNSVPVVVKDSTSLYDAIVTIFMEDVDTLIVVNEKGFLEGVLSRKDLLKITLGKMDLYKVPVSVMMTRMPNVITVTPEDSIYSAARKLVEHEIDALPVIKPVNDNGKTAFQVVGRLNNTNLVKLLVELSEA
ncbi:MAG: helix-turn-helix transcriptional regulator [Clostridia bacterium]|nr:helix-turn-helix transcriptional regulator [Clostridia bacterium]